MEIVVRSALGLLLVAHGLIHLLWFVPNDDASWPFRLDRSWLVPRAARAPVAGVLVTLVVASSVLLGLAVWGVPGLVSSWAVLAIGAATTSLVTLVLFWDRRLLLGVVFDLALVVVAPSRPTWTDGLG